jgi:DNA-binding MarR family transcriptional regulator
MTDIAPLMAASRIVTAAIVRSLSRVSATVSVPQLRVLVMLSTRGRMNLSSVAEALGVNVSNASRTCDKLVRADLVDRQTDPHDRRHVSLDLTRAGRQLVDEVMAHREQLLGSVVEEMPPADQERLMAALAQFNAAAVRLDETSGVDATPADHVEGSIAAWLT